MREALRYGLPLGLLAVLAVAVWWPDGLDLPARLALFAFGGATILWTTSTLSTAMVALGSVLFLVLTRAIPDGKLFGALSSDVVWLLIGTFIISAAFTETGLAARLGSVAARGETSVAGACWRLTAGIVPLAFVIPSTSGRAAIMLPLFRTLVKGDDQRRIGRALALLIPSVILVSTAGSLVGAGSHLVADDLLHRATGQRIGFMRWALYGLPFAIAASVLTCIAVTRLFLDGEERKRRIELEAADRGALSGEEWRTLVVSVVMIGLWVTQGLHPFGIAFVAMLGGFALTVPWMGVLTWKTGIGAVNWSLILFVGAALTLSGALIDTGAADWLVKRSIALSGLSSTDSPAWALIGLVFVTATSHLYFSSHTARMAALLPPLLVLGKSMHLDAVALTFIVSAGIDYCLTFPVSSKALLLFEQADEASWTPADLLKLSAVMLPVYAVLIVGFYYGYWRPLGLEL